MQKVAQNWLVLTIGGSPFWLGLDTFVAELPILLLTLVGGVVADRHDRRLLLTGSQVVQLTCAFALAALVYFDIVRIWHVLVISGITGTAQAFGGPASQSLLPSLVPRHDVPNAVALNSIQFNLSRVLGPMFAGLALASLGMTACFLLNGLSFFVVIFALLAMRLDPLPRNERRSILEEMRTGLAFVRSRPALLELTVLAFLTTFLSLPMQTLLPVMAREVFAEGVGGYSRLMICSGLGAVVGAAIVAWRGQHPHMGREALYTQAVAGLLLLLFASSRVLAISYVLLFATSMALIVLTSTSISLAQLAAPDALRGRVMSVFMVAFRGGMPLGSLTFSTVASAWTAPLALSICGLLLVAVALWFLTKGRGVKAM